MFMNLRVSIEKHVVLAASKKAARAYAILGILVIVDSIGE